MTFTVEKYTMSNFLQTEVLYVVPGYQRHYAWKSIQQFQFLDDFEKQIGKNSDYYLGQILTAGQGTRAAIVDGQQRIITTIIVLRVVINLLEEYKSKLIKTSSDTSRINAQINRYKSCLAITRDAEPERKIITEDNSIILNAIIDGDYSEALINNTPSQQDKVLSESFITIQHEITQRANKTRKIASRSEYVMDLMNAILSSQLVSIHDTNKESGFKIFKDINSKGIPLTQLDLLKSSIFEEQNNKPATAMQQIESRWKSLESCIYEKLNMDFFDFIVLAWGILYPQSIDEIESGASLYDLYNEATTKEKDVSTKLIENLIDIEDIAEIFFLNSVYSQKEQYKGFNDSHSAIKNLLSKNDYKSLQKIEFAFIALDFKNKRSSSSSQAKAYRRVLRECSSLFLLLSTLLLLFKFNKGQNERIIYTQIEALISETHKLILMGEPNELSAIVESQHNKIKDIISQDDLSLAFTVLTFNDKANLKWDNVSKSIMYQLANNQNSRDGNDDDYSIEHIIDKEFTDIRNRYSIGNLLVLNKFYNDECNDLKSSIHFDSHSLKDYLLHKFKIYEKSDYFSVKTFLNENNAIDFDSNQISKRTSQLSEKYYHVVILKDE